MNQETYEQIPINKELVTGSAFMKEGDMVEVVSDASTDTVLYAEMPVETGAEVRVPLFCNIGDKIRIDTRDGSYLERVKE